MDHKVDLICPECQSNLAALVRHDAKFQCACGAQYEHTNGVHRLVPDDAYLKTFSFQWKKYYNLYDSPDEIEGTERTLRKLHITPELVKGKKVLDVGCGTGRFSRTLADWGAIVVAVDLSEAIYVAQENSGTRDNIIFAYADLFKLPFPTGYFDVILAWGVLHHTPNTESAFKAVVQHLKPGGVFSVYIYGKSKGSRRRMQNFYRKLTPHLPIRVLYAFCLVAAPMYYLYKLPIVGRLLRVLIPMSQQKDYRLRIAETFDEFSPKYAWRHTFPEVHQWFVDVGMRDNAIYDPPILATGVMPSELA